MKDKDYIYVYDKFGKRQKMELVFFLDKGDFQYIIYNDINKKLPLYMAKIKLQNGMQTMDTDLSEEEIEMLYTTMKKTVLNGIGGK